MKSQEIKKCNLAGENKIKMLKVKKKKGGIEAGKREDEKKRAAKPTRSSFDDIHTETCVCRMYRSPGAARAS